MAIADSGSIPAFESDSAKVYENDEDRRGMIGKKNCKAFVCSEKSSSLLEKRQNDFNLLLTISKRELYNLPTERKRLRQQKQSREEHE